MENNIERKLRLINKTLKSNQAIIIDRETYSLLKKELLAEELNFFENSILVKANNQ